MPKQIVRLEDDVKNIILRRILSLYNFDYSKTQNIIDALQEYRESYKLSKKEKVILDQMITSGDIPKIEDQMITISNSPKIDLKDVHSTITSIKKEPINPVKMKVIKTEREVSLDNILIIGPPQSEFCQFSENIIVGFDKLGKRTAYISPQDLYGSCLTRCIKEHDYYPLSYILQKIPFIPDLIIIDECNILFENDINYIPVFYYHREYKRPPSVNYPDLVFFFHNFIIEYFENIMAPNWMYNVKHHKVLPFGVNRDIYQPKEKIYKGVTGIGFRETLEYIEKVNEITVVPIAHIMYNDYKKFKKLGFRYFDTPISNERYRELLPQCEAIWISPASQQYLTHKMYEAMACKTLCILTLESQEHEKVLQEAGFEKGIHYIGVNRIDEIEQAFIETTNKKEIINNAFNKITNEHTYIKIAKLISDLYFEIAPKILSESIIDYKEDPADLNIIVSSVERCGVSWFCYFISMIYERMYHKRKTWTGRISRLEASNIEYMLPTGWNTVEYVPIEKLIQKPYDKVILLQRKPEAIKEALLYYYYNSQIYTIHELQKPTLDYKKDKENLAYKDWFGRIDEYYAQVYAETDSKKVLRVYIEDLNNYTISTFNEILDFLEFKKEDRPFLIPINTPERVWGAFSSVYQKGDLINERLQGIHKNFSNSELDFNRRSLSQTDIVPARDVVLCDGIGNKGLILSERAIQKDRDFTLNPFLDTIDILKVENIKNEHIVDIICPIYWITDSLFLDNIKSWIDEIPINRVIFGINKKDLDFNEIWFNKIKEIAPHIEIQIIDQTHFKTLGRCLADLMTRVETKWFVFVHSDVRILQGSFERMESYTQSKNGIIESERIFYNGEIYRYGKTHRSERSYSGFQLIQKDSINNILDEIEDDFIYRNEDLIFQSRCIENGFKYIKVKAFHIHQILNRLQTFSKPETTFMQWKGLVKYTQPNKITTPACTIPAMRCIKEYNLILIQILAFTWEFNPNWGELMIECYNKWKKVGEIK